ncbi:MAG: DUF6240 domain-containing protein [Lachnospiraceae bacterium]|nr:DUF6240 domain-containing protein [Lachnospiraceae bacterium]
MRIEKANVLDVTQKEGLEMKGAVSTGETAPKNNKETVWENKNSIRATYENPKTEAAGTMQDVMAQASVMDATLMKNEMLVTGNSVTLSQSDAMREEGFSLCSTDVKTVVTITDKIKMQLAKAGVDVSCMGDGLSEEKIAEITGNAALAVQIAGTLEQAGLPVTEENIEESIEVLKQTENLTELSDGAMKYLVDQELPPTVENIYKAEYSASVAYPKNTNTEIDYTALKGQIDDTIVKSGLALNDRAEELSHLMIQNDIAFTPENLSYYNDLKNLELPISPEDVLTAITDAISEGKRPKDALLLAGYSLEEKAAQAVEIVKNATEEDVDYVISNGLELTVSNLKEASNVNQNHEAENAQIVSDEVEISDKGLALLTAKRQLEEARLVMTKEANYALLKRGISIDTKSLEELVEELKNVENNYYKTLLEQGNIDASEENVTLFSDTVTTVSELKAMPAYTLGIPKAEISTLDSLHNAGTALQKAMEKAGESYETLMTVPRKDLGDSIQKAFRNVDAILTDLELETSAENERAVRILAYNNLEITEESVAKMKATDETVQRVFENLSPAVVREMIRKGKNPLDMSLDELNQTAEEINDELDPQGSEHFSEYLWKLEQNNEISEKERDAYIGIYRLLRQIEKTDGAAIGALVEQGAEITMRNLLMEVRSKKHSNMDISINDSYGVSQKIKSEGKSITEQIERAYQTDCAKSALDMLSPERLQMVGDETTWGEMTPEELLEKMQQTEVSEQENENYIKAQRQDVEAAMTAQEEVYQLLMDYDMPNTVYNVLAAKEFLYNRNGAYRRLFAKDADERKDTDLEEAKAKMLEKYGEAIKTPEAMKEAQENLEKTAERAMDTMLVDHANVTSLKVKEMKLMRTEIELGSKMMARDESYVVPILIQNEITSVHLRVVRDEAEKGLVNITFDTDSLGKVAAQIKASSLGVTGYVASDREDTVSLFEAKEEEISLAVSENVPTLKESGATETSLNFVYSKSLDLNTFERQEQVRQNGEKELSKIQTATLYDIARNFLEVVKNLEK